MRLLAMPRGEQSLADTVRLLLDFLASGMTEAEILADYPHLTRDDLRAAMAYGAEAARERIIPVPMAA